jgi:hypothetical protein
LGGRGVGISGQVLDDLSFAVDYGS